jgi:hypothetical protein
MEVDTDSNSTNQPMGLHYTDPIPTPEPAVVHSSEPSSTSSSGVLFTPEDINSTKLVHCSTQTPLPPLRQLNPNPMTLQNYAKLIKPVLSASSRLGRALAELFGLLVKVHIVFFWDGKTRS